jgi:DNA-directed RNA polymerase I subunit RPA2
MCVFDKTLEKAKFVKFKDNESARVDNIRLMSDEKNSTNNVQVGFTIRYPRNPVIGDKFSSRHGQKGVMSVLWPQEDMPFTESGITPDVIINPHAFPSRMTIGMLIESLAAKGGSLNGKFIDIKSFEKYEDDDIIDYFGKQLVHHGYSYYGSENMYSGIFGDEMKVDIYLGVVYYQRLRHMVSDKSQARALGPIDVLTHQPVKGRKKQGGIRFGEMERDSLLAHGASFCLNDRLMKCSDYSEGYVCNKCGSIISSYLNKEIRKQERVIDGSSQDSGLHYNINTAVYCRVCDLYDCKKVAIPYVLRYMTNELAGMNIKMKFQLDTDLVQEGIRKAVKAL